MFGPVIFYVYRYIAGIICSIAKMAINYDKTKAILITTCQKLCTLPVKELSITVKEKVLENVKQEKLLSLVVDQNLSWNSHILPKSIRP